MYVYECYEMSIFFDRAASYPSQVRLCNELNLLELPKGFVYLSPVEAQDVLTIGAISVSLNMFDNQSAGTTYRASSIHNRGRGTIYVTSYDLGMVVADSLPNIFKALEAYPEFNFDAMGVFSVEHLIADEGFLIYGTPEAVDAVNVVEYLAEETGAPVDNTVDKGNTMENNVSIVNEEAKPEGTL